MTRKKRIVLIILLSLAILSLGFCLLYGRHYYQNRWYWGTYINDMDVSGMTLEESKASMEQKLSGYQLAIKGRDSGNLTLNGQDIDLQVSYQEEFDKLFSTEHNNKFFLFGGDSYTANYHTSYNEDKLRDIVNHSVLIQGSIDYPIVAPKSASIEYSETRQQYECIPEILGNQINEEELLTLIKDALLQAKDTLPISDSTAYPTVYKSVKVTSDDPDLQNELELRNKTALRFITWTMANGQKEQITPTEISQWITYDNGVITYKNKAINKWVEDFCLKYKTVGKNRKMKMHNKKVVTVKGGDYGWQIDYGQTLKQVKNALKEKIDKKAIQAYLDDPSEKNRKKLTFKRKVKYVNTAFQMPADGSGVDWDPQNYTEISLKKQKVFVIRDGKVAFSCKCISGKPVPDRATKKGAYYVKEHNVSRVLVGENYRTPVTNWVRITWSGTGFHSATWQNWASWSPTRYQTHGSHGCLNLSVADSKKIYDMVKYRELVVIY